MLKGIWSLLLAVVMVCCVAEASAEEADLFPDLEALYEMDYIAGAEIEPGEYILFSLPGKTGFVHLAADLMDKDVIVEEEFETNNIVSVEDGEYLIFSNSVAYHAADFYQHRTVGTGQFGVMLKVGYDLAPGVYELSVKPGKTGQYKIYSSSKHTKEDIVEELSGKELPKVEVKDGQYIQLIDCCIAGGETTLAIDKSAPKGGTVAEKKDNPRNVGSKMAGVIIMDCNIRREPNTSSAVLAVARYGKAFELLDANEKWYKVRMEDGAEGWIQTMMADVN